MDATRAILIRRYPLTESSLIAVWLTENSGKLRTTAKGARRPKSVFAGKLDLFFHCEIQCVESRRGDLHTLRDLQLLEPFDGLRSTYARTRTASYFASLADLATEPSQPVPELYDLLVRALRHIAGRTPEKRTVLHFERELCRLLGILHSTGRSPHPAATLGEHLGRLPKDRTPLLADLP